MMACPVPGLILRSARSCGRVSKDEGGREALPRRSIAVKPEKCAELVERGARGTEAVGRMRVVAVAQRQAAEQHVRLRDAQEFADHAVEPGPGFLRAGIEPVAARENHQR